MQPGRPLDRKLVTSILSQLSDALTALHAQNILHRDVKPENVLLDSQGQVKLIDLSIGTNVAELGALTSQGEFLGTVDYMAPEQRHRLHVDHRTDQYSLAAMTFEMLTGHCPLGQFRKPSDLNRRLGRGVDQVLLRALETDCEDRFGSIDEFSRELLSAIQKRRVRGTAITRNCVASLVIFALFAAGRIFGTSGESDSQVAASSKHDNILIVDTVSDVKDGDTSSIEALRLNRGHDGMISLREAILATNETASIDHDTPDEIHIQIRQPLIAGAHTICLEGKGLPKITDAVILDGTTDADFSGTPIIELSGTEGSFCDGLHLAKQSDGSTIRGLVINQFKCSGIEVQSDNNKIVGNYIGTDVTGTKAAGNTEGIHIKNAANNVIGGPGNDANIISENKEEGLDIRHIGSTGILIQGNYIGTNPSGADLGNMYGILLWDAGTTAAYSCIGGTTPEAGNVIAFNKYQAVLAQGDSQGQSILANLMHSNGFGIDLANDGPTSNDPRDEDEGPNNLQNYPEIEQAVLANKHLIVSGRLATDGTNVQYRIEFFRTSADLDVTDRQGSDYLGSTTVTTNDEGHAMFQNVHLQNPDDARVGFVTATATRIHHPPLSN